MIKITNGEGFQMTFANGWTVSVQFGAKHLCHNRNGVDNPTCPTAEIAAWDTNGEWYDFGHDTVRGFVTPDDVARFIDKVQKF
jgi:hypothetical protein